MTGAQDEPDPPPLPASQWVTGAHPAGRPAEEPARGEDEALGSAITRIEPAPPDRDEQALEATRPPRQAPPEEVTLPPRGSGIGPRRGPQTAHERETGSPAPQAETVVATPVAPARPAKPPEVETIVPERLRQGAVRRRVLIAALLLPLLAFGVGRWARARWFAPPVGPGLLQLSLTSPGAGAWAEEEVRIAGRVSGVAEPRARLDGPQGTVEVPVGADGALELVLRGLPEGEHAATLIVSGTAPDGRQLETRAPLTLRVDRTAPALTVVEPADGAQLPARAPLQLRLRLRDGSPVTLAVRVDGVVGQLTTLAPTGGEERLLTLPALAGGAHELRLEAMDAAGHTARVTRRVLVGDEPAPPAPPVGPPPVASPPPRIGLAWPDRPDGSRLVELTVEDAARVEVSLDGRVIATSAPGQLDLSGLTDGEHHLIVVAHGPGGEAREERRFLVDTTAPELELSAPAAGPSPLTVAGRVHDAHDPAPQLELFLDGGPATPLGGFPARLELAPGPHEVRVVARDAAGNASERRVSVRIASPPPVTPPPVTPPPVTPPAPPPPVVKPEDLLVRIPPRVRERITIEAVAPAALPPGTTADLLLGSTLLVQGPLPLSADLPGGRQHLTVTVRPPGAPARSQSAWVMADQTRPQIARLRCDPIGPTRSRVSAEVADASPVRVQVLLDGQPRAEALPAELELTPGAHELTLVARDDVGNEARASLSVFGAEPPPPATPAPPPEAPWPLDSSDPREREAADLFARGQWSAAHELISQVLAAGRRLRSPYLLRARIHLAYAQRMQAGSGRDSHLRAALEDVKVALINYGGDAEPRFHELHAHTLELLGRPTEAARVRERAGLAVPR